MTTRKRIQKIGVQDMGGDRAGPIDRHEHEATLVERRIDAMMMLMRDRKRRLWVTDENRRTIESMTPGDYEASGYYQRWLHALRGLVIEKGVLSEREIDKRLNEVRARHVPPTATAGTKSRGKRVTSPAARKPRKPGKAG